VNLTVKYMTRNDCYNAGRKIKPLGIMIHSTATPGVMKERWFELWNKSYKAGEIDRQVCAHAFVDDTGVLQCLPWDHRGWHAGGSANDSYIGIEMCEPPGFKYINNVMTGYDAKAQEPYFRKVWNNAIELCVYLCGLYGLTEQNIICHSEGYKLGIASNHADIMHWIVKHNETMDSFRVTVKAKLNPGTAIDNTPSDWEKTAVDKALHLGILRGTSEGNLKLHSSITRAELLVMLDRLGLFD